MMLDRAVADRLPNRAMIPTMQLLWIDGVLHQAFDETGGRPGVWVPVQSVTMRDAQTYRLAEIDPRPRGASGEGRTP